MWDRQNDRMQRRAIGTARIVVGRDGREWIVREVPAPDLDRRQTPSLVFEAPDIIRRVRSYPANWRELSDEALFELSMTW